MVNDLNLGERLEVYIDDTLYYSDLQDISADDEIMLSPLQIGQRVYYHPPGTQMEIVFFRPDARYAFPAMLNQVVRRGKTGLTLISVKPLALPRREQRREDFRVPVLLKVRLRPTEQSLMDVSVRPPFLAQNGITVDLSCGGVQVRAEHLAELETQLYIDLVIDGEYFTLLACVKRVIPPIQTGQMGAMAMAFIDPPKHAATHIRRFLLARQRQMASQLRV